MIKLIQRATASSKDGAKGLVKGIIACVFQNIAFMLPAALLYYIVADMLGGAIGDRIAFYAAGSVVCIGLILLTTWFQYNNTYFTTYEESGKRRLSLAERLRRLPLSFFGKKDLADLTSTIMADCQVIEQSSSHFIPGLFGSIISTVIISAGMFVFDWRMALSALWVIPVSVLTVLLSYRVQDRAQSKNMAVKMACADGIQEYIESMRDLKANNAEKNYLRLLKKKIRRVESQNIKTEITTAIFVTGASMILKLGIASVALTGSVLLTKGNLNVLTFFMFLLVASRLYDPLMTLYSIVFQDVTLFDNTIMENIRLGRKGATDEEVLAAARLANCDEFAEKLPDKWNTNIGENGCELSGGERQRISIARAFLQDAPIILLDEATASLDVENETAIQTALSRLIKNKTVLIIAHRMRTVAGADKIVVLSDGVVAEQGSPNELLHKDGIFKRMSDLQLTGQSWTV